LKTPHVSDVDAELSNMPRRRLLRIAPSGNSTTAWREPWTLMMCAGA
jgi:hypothetical protein